MANDLTIPTPLDEPSKAIQEASKLGQSLVGAAEKGGGYLAGILGGLPANWVGLYADQVAHKRWVQCQRLFAERERILKERKVEDAENASLSIEIPLLEAAIDEDRAELTDLWARLLAAASTPHRKGRVRKSYIETLKSFDPYDAVTFLWLSEKLILGVAVPVGSAAEQISLSNNFPKTEVIVSLSRLKDLGLTSARNETITGQRGERIVTDIVTLTGVGLALGSLLSND